MISVLVWLINILVQLITLLVIIQVFLSYFMSPFHPLRQSIDRIVEPMLRPIRRIIPPIGILDISPIVLIILVQLSGKILITLLLSINH
jgi:YggT family protein